MRRRMIYITKHAYNRGNERLGLGNREFRQQVAMAFTYGVEQSQARGKLGAYFDSQNRDRQNTLRLYNNNVYVFIDNALVTVLKLPKELKQHGDKAEKRSSDIRQHFEEH